MKKPLRSLVVLMGIGVAACGGRSASPDAGAGDASGSGGATGSGGTTGSGGATAGGGAPGSGSAGSGGATGGAAGGMSGTTGGAGNGGASGAAGGGATGTAGAGGAAGTTGAGGNAGRGGATGTAGAGGSGGRGGAAGSGGSGGVAGAGGTVGNRCTAPADCTADLPEATTFCQPAWSCVDRGCVAECMGARTCIQYPSSGCLRCTSASSTTEVSQGCATTPCALDVSRIADIQYGSSCPPSQRPDFATWWCTGQWAVVSGISGVICTIQAVPTGAVRYSVSCGSCVTIVTMN